MPSAPEIRKQKQLAIFLEKVSEFPVPDPKLEQYKTPATIAADALFIALNEGDVAGRHVVDLGCGTGIFSIGASLLGAEPVQALDIDPAAVACARELADEYDLDIEFLVTDVSECSWKCHTVLQNPPFGSQQRTADRIFLETAANTAEVIYSIHNTKTVEFIRLITDKLGFEVAFEKNYIFNLAHTFDFHTKSKADYDVTLFKLIKKN
jgi:putative methylase